MSKSFKPLFEERLKKLMPNEQDFQAFTNIVQTPPQNYIRCNTLKMPAEQLKQRLSKKWNMVQPFPQHPEILLIDQWLNPGELGNALEHLLGYYYVQELCSMMSVLALSPQPEEFVLDLCASPGSKTTQIAAAMQNRGTLIANDIKLDRIKILAANLERCGATNTIVTKIDAIALCAKLEKTGFRFDKILLDAPCSGEGTLRSSPKTFDMWNERMIDHFSRQQKKLIAFALKILKVGGTLVYSTCTHAPEENEEVINFALKNFPVKLESLTLPIKCRPGLTNWKSDSFNPEVQKTCRIYPQDNNTEGFFVSKLTLIEDLK
ncbi:MAG TPA: RsmB/NOP family class I SAM-dependent RNA methyltransferase [Candidatus Nanoarchaeia archaeon]|nr:RsmB/NOP family class I SAM-dependent RNA methyltransferase [Candidatus Nanoarchaeia archaeon]